MKETTMILTINPGSTSTKLAVFSGSEKVKESKLSHSTDEIGAFKKIMDQKEFRTQLVEEFLSKNDIGIDQLDAVVGRGGLLPPMESGTYLINQDMIDYLEKTDMEHASNLGALIAFSLAKKAGIPSFIVDPVVVDELDDVARITGLPQIERKSIFHALNHKAAARKAADTLNKEYESCRFIVAHMGGGVSVGAHENGRVIDVNNALDGDGPFAPERSGGVPPGLLLKMAFSGDYTLSDMKKMLSGRGGLVAHLNLSDVRDVEALIQKGSKQAEEVYSAMAYGIAKEIGAMAAVLEGKVDAIVMTGGVAYNDYFIDKIKKKIAFLAPVLVFPGEDEMEALNMGAIRVLNDEEEVKHFTFK